MAKHSDQLALQAALSNRCVYYSYCVPVNIFFNRRLDVQHVARWVMSHFGRRHLMTATFMNHAIANHNFMVRETFL
jgi:hypothetical protein